MRQTDSDQIPNYVDDCEHGEERLEANHLPSVSACHCAEHHRCTATRRWRQKRKHQVADHIPDQLSPVDRLRWPSEPLKKRTKI